MLLDERTRVERECELKCQTLAAQWSQRAQQREREVAELRENFLKDSQQSTRLHEQERALLRAREREWQRERDLILEAADHDREDLLRQQKLSLATEERLDAAERRGKEREEVIVVVCECVQMCVCVCVCVYVCMHVCAYICLPTVDLSICLSVCLSFCLYFYVHMYVCM